MPNYTNRTEQLSIQVGSTATRRLAGPVLQNKAVVPPVFRSSSPGYVHRAIVDINTIDGTVSSSKSGTVSEALNPDAARVLSLSNAAEVGPVKVGRTLLSKARDVLLSERSKARLMLHARSQRISWEANTVLAKDLNLKGLRQRVRFHVDQENIIRRGVSEPS